MKTFYISILILFALTTCKQHKNEPKPSPGTPAALQEKGSFSEISLKSRYDDDLVNELYKEIAGKDPDLEKLERLIDDLKDQKNDSAKLFQKFDSRNTSYYNTSQQYISRITDSALRLKMNDLVKASLDNYNKKAAKQNDLISMLDSSSISLENLHKALKIVKTLPVIEKYQSENIPSTKPLETVQQNFEKGIRKIDTLIKQ